MMRSLRSWCKFKLNVKKVTGKTGAGERTYSSPIEILCYPSGDVVPLTLDNNETYVSTIQYYIPGEYAIELGDLFEVNGSYRAPKKLTVYYDGNTGERDISVVYL